ncbi:MAG: hypothetical protein JWQ35_1435 [Bacteriovoracaceae bacterium]|nr:hypothetical protein [Bacteriovoracaceae bacterium]
MKTKTIIIKTIVGLIITLTENGLSAETSIDQKVARAETLLKQAAEDNHTERMWKGAGWAVTAAGGVTLLATGVSDMNNRKKDSSGGDQSLAAVGDAIAIILGSGIGITGAVGTIYQFAWKSAPERFYLNYKKDSNTQINNQDRLNLLERALKESAEQQKFGRQVWSGIYFAGAAASLSALGNQLAKGTRIGASSTNFWMVLSGVSVSLGLWNLLGSSSAEKAYKTYRSEFSTEDVKQSKIKFQDLNVSFAPDSHGNNQTTVGAVFKF